MEVITKSNEKVASFFKTLDRILGNIEHLVKNNKPLLNGEHYLTDKEVARKLKLSRRTLHDYRSQGKIPFIQLGGKMLYRESDIEKLLAENYYKAWQ